MIVAEKPDKTAIQSWELQEDHGIGSGNIEEADIYSRDLDDNLVMEPGKVTRLRFRAGKSD
jgi:hypothetical protein